MITCRDIYNLNLDGVTLLTEAGLDNMVSWTYIVQGKPYELQMNRGDFALLQIDYINYDMTSVFETMLELHDLGISGMAVSVIEDQEPIPDTMIQQAAQLQIPLFYISWYGASFGVITHSVGKLLLETGVKNKREGDFLYNLLFGYDINQKYIDKISNQFSLNFSKPYRVGIVIVNRKYGSNLEQDEHTYEFYADSLNREIQGIKNTPLFMKFLNKFVLLFEAKPNHEVEHEIEAILKELDTRPQFSGRIHSICILGTAYKDPRKFSASYTEAKSLIPQLEYLPNPKNKKVLSASTMGIYKYMFNSGNQEQIYSYCDRRLQKLEEYDHSNGTYLQDTLMEYYMHGFNISRTAEALYIHRNSLLYRLNKIAELLDVELDDYMEYLDLLNCILVKRFMFNNEL